MYRGWGRNICDVKYYLTENHRDFVNLDPYKFLKSDNWLYAPSKIKNLRNPQQVKLKANQMCKLIPEGQILYVKAKCGQRGKGWKIIIDNDKPFCTTKKVDIKDNISK